MNTAQILDLARSHVSSAAMASSARLCLEDAESLMREGKVLFAGRRALKSLAYSVGVLHPDYIAAARAFFIR